MNPSVDLKDCLSLYAPCPPPFFYHEFENYALSRNLTREEVCGIANRCMSKYPTENSSQIAERICSPPTEPPTSTVPPTEPPTSTIPPTEPPTSTIPPTEPPTSTILSTSSSTRTSPLTPFLSPPTVTQAGCNTTCIALIVFFLILLAVICFISLVLRYRKHGALHLNQIKWCCKGGEGDDQHLVSDYTSDRAVYYVKMSNAEGTDGDKNVKSLEEKDKRHRMTGCMVERLSYIVINDNVESNDATTDIQTHGYENVNYTSFECDTSEESSIEEINIHCNTHASETGSMITHVSSALILDNVDSNDTILHVQTETSIQDKENMKTDATELSSVLRDNSDVGDEKEEECLDLKGKMDGGGDIGIDKKEADMEQGPSVDIHKNKKYPTDTQQHESEVAEMQIKKTADDGDMNMDPEGENKGILKEDESISKFGPTETVKDVISQGNVEADGGGEKLG